MHNVDLLAKRQVEPVDISPVPDRFTPHPPPINWIGLGDSYTASPGTGKDFDPDKQCRRNIGSYVFQLQSNFPFTEANHTDFIACSGYTTKEVLEKTLPTIKAEKEATDFMVMTLGGNDIGFANIARDCLIVPSYFWHKSSCEETIVEATKLIQSVELQTNIHSVYDELFRTMKDDYHYQLYHIFYSRFFDSTTSWCDDQRFYGKVIGPPLTRIVRERMNALADQLNSRLEEIAANYIKLQQGRASWAKTSRLITINPDKVPEADGSGTYGLFDGHRFCEPGATTLESDNVWFFGLADNDDTSDTPLETPDTFKRGIDAALDEGAVNNGSNPIPFPPTPEWLIQTFHPKTGGMRSIMQQLSVALQKNRPAEKSFS